VAQVRDVGVGPDERTDRSALLRELTDDLGADLPRRTDDQCHHDATP
jgi:hypothetical protein